MKPKNFLLPLLVVAASLAAIAQQSVSIGTTTTDPAAVLLLVGNNQGLIIPKTSSPSGMPVKEGMLVYNLTDKKVYYCDGQTWAALGGATAGASPVLSINGNQVSIFAGANVKLSDANPTTAGQLFMWDGNKWTSTSPTAPTTNQVLQWNGTTWAPATLPTGSAATFKDLTSTTPGLSITGGTGAVASTAGTSIAIQSATATQPGLLTAADFATFNNKLAGNILTTGGDLLYHDGTTTNRLAKGANGTALLSTATGVQWANLPGGGDMIKSAYDTNNDGIIDVAATVNLGSQAANTVLAAPSVAAGVPAFRTLVGADLPSFDVSKLTTGTLGVARGGTGLGTVPTLGQLLIGNGTGYGLGSLTAGSGITITPAAGSINIASTGFTNPMTAQGDIIFGGASGAPTRLAGAAGFLKSTGAAAPIWSTLLAADIPNLDATKITTGTVPVARGGTGITTATNGQLLIGNGTGLVPATLTAGTNIGIVNGAGSITINSTGLANPLTTTGDIIYATGTTPTRLAGAAGFLKSTGAAAPAWAALTATDIPGLDASKITSGILPVTLGGTGKTTWNGLVFGSGTTLSDISTGTPGQVLGVAGTTPTWQNIPSQFNILNTVPKGDGTGMIASQIFDDGTNVGIGTATPLGKLHIDGADWNSSAVTISSGGTSAGSTLRFINPVVGNHVYDIIGSTDAGAIPGIGAFGIWDQTVGDYRMVILPSGNVGFGTTAPIARLDAIGGSIRAVNATTSIASNVDGAVRGSNSTGTYASLGTQNNGIYAFSTNGGGAAVFGDNNASGTVGYAGYFNGRVTVTGTLSKGGGSFKIDHPLDPENKYLYHSFVESPDMMNIYNGNTETDAAGYATVILPTYFESLNREFRYQLTVIGQFAQAIVAREISDNQFVINTDKPNVRVSWQVTGVRKDPFAEKNRIPVEELKAMDSKGKYLHSEAYGQPRERQEGITNEAGAVKN